MKRVNIDFRHRQSAHCESGSTANLLFNHGINVSEPLVFGIGSGLFFGYFPFLKIHGLPLITFRNAPGRILRNTAKRMGLQVKSFRFRNPERAMDTLDETLRKGIPVGLQTGVYWLPYFPAPLRFHFNAHSLIAYGVDETGYRLSDPVFDEPVTCSRADLMKARFAKGMLAPKGKMHYLLPSSGQIDLARAVRDGIKETCRMMLKVPLPLIGVRGIRRLARQVAGWPEQLGKRKALIYLGHTIRMQEEIGTGGGGFRLMYAAFLQQAAPIIEDHRLLGLSDRMTEIGDLWREFAVSGARICKNRAPDGGTFDQLSRLLLECADREQGLFGDLMQTIK